MSLPPLIVIAFEPSVANTFSVGFSLSCIVFTRTTSKHGVVSDVDGKFQLTLPTTGTIFTTLYVKHNPEEEFKTFAVYGEKRKKLERDKG